MDHVAEKSTIASILLTFFFGPFGLFYTRSGWKLGLISVGVLLFAFITFGIVWLIGVIVSMVMGIGDVTKHNEAAIRNRAKLQN